MMPTAARRKCREIAAAATARRRALGLEGEGEGLGVVCVQLVMAAGLRGCPSY